MFFYNVLKARRLNSELEKYKKLRHLAISPPGSLPESARLRHQSTSRKYLQKWKRKDSFRFFLLKSSLGFLGGVVLTYIFFIFFILGVNFSLKKSTYICTVFAVVFSLGLAFSSNVRCYVALLLPVFFSKRGRQALLIYAFVLALTGPAKNMVHNFGVMSDSMACQQEQLKRTLRDIVDMVKAPFRSMKQRMAELTKALEQAVNKVMDKVLKMKRIVLSVLSVIKKATSWLGSIVSFCNKEMGTPFERCMRTFDDAIVDCKASLGIMDFLCHIVHVVRPLCYTVKFLDYICLFVDFVTDAVVEAVQRRLSEFTLQMKTMFAVSVEFSSSYSFKSESSKSFKSVASLIEKEISEKVAGVMSAFDVMGLLLSFLFFFVFLKVMYYRYKFLSSDKFDNYYLTQHFMELDVQRIRVNKECLLPLTTRERKHYCKPSSLGLLKSENRRIMQSFFFLTISTFKVCSYMFCDYSLYWLLSLVRQFGHQKFSKVEVAEVGVQVEGHGLFAALYNDIIGAFKPSGSTTGVDFVPCLPEPMSPDYGRYLQIAFLTVVCWVLAVLEPYGLRVRSVVMSHYYPGRAKQRAVWLYNHIIRSRSTFLKFARRQLRRKWGRESTSKEHVTLAQALTARFPVLGYLFGKRKITGCLMCGTVESNKQVLIRCVTQGCAGAYCIDCFASLHNLCTLCQSPLDYGDVSDISEERDSSEESMAVESGAENIVQTMQDKLFLTGRQVDEKPSAILESETTTERVVSVTSGSEERTSKLKQLLSRAAREKQRKYSSPVSTWANSHAVHYCFEEQMPGDSPHWSEPPLPPLPTTVTTNN